MRAHCPGERGRERNCRRRERGDRHAASRLGRSQVCLGRLDHGQDLGRAGGQPPAGLGELSRPGGPVKQCRAGLPLQRG